MGMSRLFALHGPDHRTRRRVARAQALEVALKVLLDLLLGLGEEAQVPFIASLTGQVTDCQ
jgi:hypothetical protein